MRLASAAGPRCARPAVVPSCPRSTDGEFQALIARRALGRTGLQVSELGFGCSSFWAKSAFPERSAIALVHAALEHGINFFDTGSSYAGGQAESRLGQALRGRSKHDLVIATKVGTRNDRLGQTYKDFRPVWVRQSVEESLRRLGLEVLPLLHLHVPAPSQLTEELIACLVGLRDAGLVRYFGVHGAGDALHGCVLESECFSTAMFDYNVLHARRRSRIRALVAAGRGFLAATPLAQSLYGNKVFRPRRPADLWYLARAVGKHRADLSRGRRFRFIERFEGWTGAQVALGYVLSNADVSVAIFGTTSQARLLENVNAAGRALPPEIIERIESVA